MNPKTKAAMRCAIYTRKSSEEGLEQSFNSLDAQREFTRRTVSGRLVSPPRSLDCRESPRLFFTDSPKDARFSRFPPGKSDRRERTARQRWTQSAAVFSDAGIGSPTSWIRPG